MPRIDPESNPTLYSPPAIAAGAQIFPLVPDDELETPPLPREHPKWVKDAVAVSSRTRRLIAGLRPIAVRILTFWDHTVRTITLGSRRLSIDPSGSYRVE